MSKERVAALSRGCSSCAKVFPGLHRSTLHTDTNRRSSEIGVIKPCLAAAALIQSGQGWLFCKHKLCPELREVFLKENMVCQCRESLTLNCAPVFFYSWEGWRASPLVSF